MSERERETGRGLTKKKKKTIKLILIISPGGSETGLLGTGARVCRVE